MRDTERERQRHRQIEKQAPCREPDERIGPRTLGSRPEPKADAQPLSHSVPENNFFFKQKENPTRICIGFSMCIGLKICQGNKVE